MDDRPRRTRRWWLLAGIGLVGMCGLCFALTWVLVLRMRSSPAEVTDQLQAEAEAALQNPWMAKIDLGVMEWPSWYPADRRDFAVEQGWVIYPQPPRVNAITRPYTEIMPDKTMPALVYAPDNESMPSGNTPQIPDGRTWAYMGEWYLYACRPVEGWEGWWRCELLVGGNI